MATPEPPHLPQPRLHVVLHSFSSAGPGEMTVARGESVLVEAEGAGGWLLCRLANNPSGLPGHVPASYLGPSEAPPFPAAASPLARVAETLLAQPPQSRARLAAPAPGPMTTRKALLADAAVAISDLKAELLAAALLERRLQPRPAATSTPAPAPRRISDLTLAAASLTEQRPRPPPPPPPLPPALALAPAPMATPAPAPAPPVAAPSTGLNPEATPATRSDASFRFAALAEAEAEAEAELDEGDDDADADNSLQAREARGYTRGYLDALERVRLDVELSMREHQGRLQLAAARAHALSSGLAPPALPPARARRVELPTQRELELRRAALAEQHVLLRGLEERQRAIVARSRAEARGRQAAARDGGVVRAAPAPPSRRAAPAVAAASSRRAPPQIPVAAQRAAIDAAERDLRARMTAAARA